MVCGQFLSTSPAWWLPTMTGSAMHEETHSIARLQVSIQHSGCGLFLNYVSTKQYGKPSACTGGWVRNLLKGERCLTWWMRQTLWAVGAGAYMPLDRQQCLTRQPEMRTGTAYLIEQRLQYLLHTPPCNLIRTT